MEIHGYCRGVERKKANTFSFSNNRLGEIKEKQT